MRARRLLPLVLLLVAAPPAGAATVSVEDGELRVFSPPGAAERLSVYPVPGGAYGVSQLPGGAPLTAGTGCVAESAIDLRCPLDAVAFRIVASGGDGNDALDFSTVADHPVVAYGGPGNDTFTGGARGDSFDGGAGRDYANPGLGSDVLAMGPGDDYADLPTPAARKILAGGDGLDYASFEGAAAGVRVTLDGRANDGAIGDRANIGTDVENVIGSPFADTLVGNAADNQLEGRAGRDVLAGGDGSDGLDGGAGNDAIAAGEGVDDDVVCGTGADRADVDLADSPADCERRTLAIVPALVTDRIARGRVRALRVRTSATAARVVVRCRGTGCPLRRRTLVLRDGTVRVGPLFRGAVLARGTVLTLRVSARNLQPALFRYVIR